MHKFLKSQNIQLTRYLYFKEEVMISLFISILHSNYEEALFWAFELFYSGFKSELTSLLWTIYYNFFYCLNPALETYLFIKFKDDKIKEITDEKHIRLFIDNFSIRKKGHDMYLFMQMVEEYEFDNSYAKTYIDNPNSDISILYPIFNNLLETNDYLVLTNLIINIIYDKHLDALFTYVIQTLFGDNRINKHKKLYNYYSYHTLNKPDIYRIVILANVFHFIYLKQNIKLSKNIYATENNNNTKYRNLVNVNCEKKYKVLPKVYIYSVDTYGYLSLFPIQRKLFKNNDEVKQIVYNNWTNYIYTTPLWIENITEFNGVINENNNQKVLFDTDELYENFCNKYYYEFEEQSLSTQEKAIPKLVKNYDILKKWLEFNKSNCLLEEYYDKELADDLLFDNLKLE